MAADQHSSGPPRPPGVGMLVLPGGAQASSSKYDEAEFLVGGKGKSNAEMPNQNFRLHEGYAAEAMRWLQTAKFPYRTVSDLFRHAVVRHLRYFLPSMEGEVEGTVLHQMAQIDELVAKWRFENDFTAQIDAVAAEVNRTLSMPGGQQEVERMLRAMYKHIEQMKPGYYKGVYMKMFNERFGPWLRRRNVLGGGFGKDDSGVVEFPRSAYEQNTHAYDEESE